MGGRGRDRTGTVTSGGQDRGETWIIRGKRGVSSRKGDLLWETGWSASKERTRRCLGMGVGAEPGSEIYGWGKRVGAHRVLNKAFSWGSKSSSPLRPSSRRPLYSTAGGSARGSQPREEARKPDLSMRLPPFPHIPSSSQGQEFSIKILGDVRAG